MKLDRDTLELTRAELKALLAFASHDEARPHLHGIQADLGHCPPRLSATDGHRLLVGLCVGDRVGGTVTAPVVIDRAELDLAVKLAKPNQRIRLALGPPVEETGGSAARRLSAPAGVVSIQVVNEAGAVVASFWQRQNDAVKAPPIDRVIPDPDPGARVGSFSLEAKYLADLLLMREAAASDPPAGMQSAGIRVHAPNCYLDPVLFDCGAWLAIIMPLRGKESEQAKPVKVAPAPETAPAPAVEPASNVVALPKPAVEKRSRKRKHG